MKNSSKISIVKHQGLFLVHEMCSSQVLWGPVFPIFFFLGPRADLIWTIVYSWVSWKIKGTQESFTLAFKCSSLQVTHNSSTWNLLVRTSHMISPKLKEAMKGMCSEGVIIVTTSPSSRKWLALRPTWLLAVTTWKKLTYWRMYQLVCMWKSAALVT